MSTNFSCNWDSEEEKKIIEVVLSRGVIPIDKWVPENEDEKIYKIGKRTIQCNECTKLLGLEPDSDMSYFIMSAKRGYNSRTQLRNGKISIGFKDHCTSYLNYFEKFYDVEHELPIVQGQMKYCIDYMDNDKYTEDVFINDLVRCIISYDKCANPDLHYKVRKLVEDNYAIELEYSNSKDPSLEYTEEHAKLLLEISFLQNCMIPLLVHFAWVNQYDNQTITRMLLRCYDILLNETKKYYGIDIASKLYETSMTNAKKSANSNKILWDMQSIRSRDISTHSMNTVEDLIIQVFPKYVFNRNVICFNYNAINKEINNKVLDAQYEYQLASVSSSDRDEDDNSEADKFEAHISKLDESLLLQSNVNCEYTMKKIINKYGPFDEGEIWFYMGELSKGNKPIKNSFQFNLVMYPFYKEFKDINAARLISNINYIICMIAVKRMLISNGQSLLPYIISGRAERLVSRKTVNKKIMQRIMISENYPKVENKYNNRKIQEENIFKLISQILSSKFVNIDYYHREYNGIPINVQYTPEKLCEEILQYILII